MNKFWDWIRDDGGGRVLRLEGPIDSESFWGDEMTPKSFREDLYAEEGDITLWINSPGGSVFAAAEIYTMLRDYPGKVTVCIASIAASAASVVAMAGDKVQMSPTALLMLHDPSTIAMGNAKDMEKAITTLNEVKESIINAYQFKSGLSRNRISKLMENETWLNAKKAVELGFADEILFEANPSTSTDEPEEPEPAESGEGKTGEVTLESAKDTWQYSTKIMDEAILNMIGVGVAEVLAPIEEPTVPVDADKSGVEDTPGDQSDPIHIGLDGKTANGSMPYLILKDKLEWMK